MFGYCACLFFISMAHLTFVWLLRMSHMIGYCACRCHMYIAHVTSIQICFMPLLYVYCACRLDLVIARDTLVNTHKTIRINITEFIFCAYHFEHCFWFIITKRSPYRQWHVGTVQSSSSSSLSQIEYGTSYHVTVTGFTDYVLHCCFFTYGVAHIPSWR